MKSVGARFGDDVGGRAEAIAKFGGGVMSEDSEFGDRVDRWLKDESAVNAIEVVRAVNEEIVGFGTLSIDRVRLTFTERRPSLFQSGCERHDTRLQRAQLAEVPAIEGKIQNLTFKDDFAESTYRSLDQLSVGIHFDFWVSDPIARWIAMLAVSLTLRVIPC